MQKQIFSVAENNPKLLTKLATEVQENIKNGVPQKQAMENVARKNKEGPSKVLSGIK